MNGYIESILKKNLKNTNKALGFFVITALGLTSLTAYFAITDSEGDMAVVLFMFAFIWWLMVLMVWLITKIKHKRSLRETIVKTFPKVMESSSLINRVNKEYASNQLIEKVSITKFIEWQFFPSVIVQSPLVLIDVYKVKSIHMVKSRTNMAVGNKIKNVTSYVVRLTTENDKYDVGFAHFSATDSIKACENLLAKINQHYNIPIGDIIEEY